MNKLYVEPKIVVVCGDPGGAGAIAPVIRIFQESKTVKLRVLAYREACTVWADLNISFETLPEDLTIIQAGNMMLESQASLLLCGTSYNSIELEKRFIAASRSISIPSLVVLDFWSNYLVRFQDAAGKLAFVPDKIAVMDQLAFEELSTLGINPNCLVITGQPAFDDLIAWRRYLTPERKKVNRRELNISDNEILVLFASQPFAEVFGNSNEYMGYDEFIVSSALLTALEEIAIRHNQRITLLLRPHPREKTPWVDLLHSKHVRILISSIMDRRDQSIAADLVVGMNSEMLVETCYIGCPTISLQPGLILPDALPTNRSGLSMAVYTFDEIPFVIEQMLFDKAQYEKKQKQLLEYALGGGAARRVADLAYEMATKSIWRKDEQASH